MALLLCSHVPELYLRWSPDAVRVWLPSAFTDFRHVWRGRGTMVLNHLRTFSVFWGSEWDPGRKSDCWMMRVQIPHLTTHLFKKGDRLALGSPGTAKPDSRCWKKVPFLILLCNLSLLFAFSGILAVPVRAQAVLLLDRICPKAIARPHCTVWPLCSHRDSSKGDLPHGLENLRHLF